MDDPLDVERLSIILAHGFKQTGSKSILKHSYPYTSAILQGINFKSRTFHREMPSRVEFHPWGPFIYYVST